MPSSTSNSETSSLRFPAQVVGWALTFWVAYSLWLAWAQPTVTRTQSHSGANALAVERYLYGEAKPVVLVGSSLTHSIPEGSLGPQIANLGMSRESALTGIETLLLGDSTPERVVIEVNSIMLDINQPFVDRFSSPLTRPFKRAFSSLRTEGEPINVILSKLRDSYGRSASQKRQEVEVDLTFLAGRIDAMAEAFKNAPDEETLGARLAVLSEQVRRLEALGAIPIFIQMPIEAPLEDSVYMTTLRERVEEAFPPARYRWIDTHREAPYRTNDGHHLVFADAWFVGERITRVLRHEELGDLASRQPIKALSDRESL